MVSGRLPEQLPLFSGFISVGEVSSGVGVCFGPGRAALGQLCFQEPPLWFPPPRQGQDSSGVVL